MGTAILVLAATIGASTAIFALVDAVLIRPLPLTDQNRLVVMWAAEPDSPLIEISYPDFLDFRNETKAFQDLAAHGSTPWSLLMTGVGDPVVMQFGAVSGSFFDVLGARAHLGRTLHPSDEAPGAPAVVVLSHPLWQQRFGSDPSVVGRVISLDNEPHTVVGIMPPRFNYPAGSQLWAPLKRTIDALEPNARDNLRRIGFLYMVGRLGPGISADQATEDSLRILRGLFERYQLALPERRPVMTPLVHQILGPTRPALVLLATAAALVLLLACVNVAGLALVRALARQSEVAVRRALGASRLDILRLLLAEAALLCASAAIVAVPMAYLCLRFFVTLAPSTIAGIEETSIGLRALAFAMAAGALAAVFATVQPLLVLALRDSVRLGPSSQRVTGGAGFGRQVIIAVEIALAVTVLTAAGLAVRSFINIRGLDLGYTAGRVLLVETPGDDEHRIGEALAGLPGVLSVGAISLRPLTLGPIGDDVTFQLEAQSIDDAQKNPTLNLLRASPGYFEAMGIRLLGGRFFDARDVVTESLVTIVSDVTAQALWGRTDVVGKKIRIFRLTPDERFSTVVGVVGSVRPSTAARGQTRLLRAHSWGGDLGGSHTRRSRGARQRGACADSADGSGEARRDRAAANPRGQCAAALAIYGSHPRGVFDARPVAGGNRRSRAGCLCGLAADQRIRDSHGSWRAAAAHRPARVSVDRQRFAGWIVGRDTGSADGCPRHAHPALRNFQFRYDEPGSGVERPGDRAPCGLRRPQPSSGAG